MRQQRDLGNLKPCSTEDNLTHRAHSQTKQHRLKKRTEKHNSKLEQCAVDLSVDIMIQCYFQKSYEVKVFTDSVAMNLPVRFDINRKYTRS